MSRKPQARVYEPTTQRGRDWRRRILAVLGKERLEPHQIEERFGVGPKLAHHYIALARAARKAK